MWQFKRKLIKTKDCENNEEVYYNIFFENESQQNLIEKEKEWREWRKWRN